MFDFSDRVVVVTGAAGGLGSVVARAFAAAGAHVVPVDHREGRLQRMFPEFAESGGHLLAEGIDLTVPDDVARMVQAAMDRFGRVDVLVNAIGGFSMDGPLHKTQVESFDHMWNLNARTVFLTSQHSIPHMLEQGGGKIINVSARKGLEGGKRLAGYSAAKSAVIRLTETMSHELRKDGINVNCVLPGTIDTADNREAMPEANHERWVAPESLADVIMFLASEAARDVHGAAVPVYGLS